MNLAIPDAPKKRKKPHSNVKESLALLKKRGYACAIVEKWNPHAKIRQDLFGGIDVLAIRFGETMGVQCSRNDDLAAHRTKLLAEKRMRTWVEAGNRLVLHGWAMKGARGKRKLWEVREQELRVGDFDVLDPTPVGAVHARKEEP